METNATGYDILNLVVFAGEVEQKMFSIVERISEAGFQAACIFISISCLYFSIVRAKAEKIQNKIFLCIIIDILLAAICDAGAYLVSPLAATSQAAWTALRIFDYIYFPVHCMLSPLFSFYISLVTGACYRLSKKHRYLYEFPIYVIELLSLLNPLTGWVYGYDEQRQFVRHWAEFVVYMTSVCYFMYAVICIFLFWNAVTGRKKRMLGYFFLMVSWGTLFQFLFPDLHVELFAEALAMTGIMVTVENEEDLKNPRTGIYNETALSADVRTYLAVRRSFEVICVKLVNFQNLLQVLGVDNMELLKLQMGEYFEQLVNKYNLYYLGFGTFAIVREKREENGIEIAREIRRRFMDPWSTGERENVFHAVVFYAEIPKDLHSYDQIMALIESNIQSDMGNKDDICFGSDLDFLLRTGQVERAILSGLENHNFEVYYQPIYGAKDMLIQSGEALLRLHDAEIGDIYPEEFLPMAERSGLIFELGDFVLDEVCKFLNSGIPVEMGIETLNVNLSVVQCIQPSYAERLLQIASRYDVDPGRINFELRESAASSNFEGLRQFVDTMRGYGFRFSVDDYGIGYSNVHSIFSLDVDFIKIDRRILWEAQDSEIGRIIMESSVGMIRRMGKKILISGVENKEQIDFAEGFGVDYFQGFYFSNPVTQNEFIGILKATQLARIEEQKALAASEAMSNFLANMSHEIRTPINAVLGMDEMILRECEDERILEYARTIEGAGRTLLSLINDVLDFSKIEAGNMDIVEGEYELSSVLADVVNMVQIKAGQKGLKLGLEVDPATPERLYGDEIRLRQIMLNILNNAVKYTKKGRVTLKVQYHSNGQDRVELVIAVQDTGIGIREEEIGKLFQKFQRLDADRNKTVEGSGLGLAIAHELMELMGGRIEVESEYGQGSTFTIFLPQRVMGEETVGDFRKKFARAGESMRKYRESFRAPGAEILVVDDTPMNLVVVRELLKKTELHVDEAHSGAECLKMIRKKRYDVIFLDYRMPVMDGIETLKKMKEMSGHPNLDTPVIALTANAISGARERFLSEGFDDYMSKPIDGERLEEMLLIYLPEEKVERTREEEAAESDGETFEINESLEPDVWKSEIRANRDLNNGVKCDIDRKKGIKNCGSEETYRTVLSAFRGEIEERSAIIRRTFEEQDWDRYMIEVHAIKSSAKMVGADELSKLAARLELAAEQVETGRLEEDTPRLLELYESCMSDSQKADTPARDDSEKRPLLDDAGWQDACSALNEFAELMDLDNAMLVLDSLGDYRLTTIRQKEIRYLRELAAGLKWDEFRKRLASVSQR